MRTITALLLATLSTSAAAQAATLAARVENGNILIVLAKGDAHDEICGALVHFLYRDPAAAKDSEKHGGTQTCAAMAIPAHKIVEVCRLTYASATDIEVQEAVKPTCTPTTAAPAK